MVKSENNGEQSIFCSCHYKYILFTQPCVKLQLISQNISGVNELNFLFIIYYIYQTLCLGRIWHKVNF